MNQDKMHLMNKIFNNETIRTIWDKDEEKYFISVVDIVSVITDSKDGRKYWNKLKQRLSKEGNETVTICHQLKLKAQDGKYRMTNGKQTIPKNPPEIRQDCLPLSVGIKRGDK